MLLKVVFLSAVLVVASVGAADARGSSARYSMYGYGGSTGANDYDGGRSYGSSGTRYQGYNTRSYSSNTGRYWGSVSIQKYNDPTGNRIVEISPPTPPLPKGNYGRAANKLRQAY